MRRPLMAVLLASALAPGCSKHVEAPAAPSAVEATNTTAAPSTAPTPAAPQRPVGHPLGVVIAPPAGADWAPTLSKMTGVLREYIYDRREVPASVEVLVESGYFKQIPPPPAGKKFAVEPKQRQIVLADR